jgi:glycosyltransferase involved in cell wall biosynthesis
MPFPISLIGNIAERVYLKLYKNNRFITISDSTKQNLIKYCWAKPKNIFISEMQIDFKPVSFPEHKENQFVFCARFVKSKRAQDCIKALSLAENKESKLYIIGEGPYKSNLENLTKKLNLKDRVIFTGRVSMKERNKIMAESQAILVTSIREGWGLIVTEANANGTLAITYNIHGLRDANKVGIITKSNTPKELAKEMDNILGNQRQMLKLSRDSIAFAKAHNNWNKQSEELEQWLGK